LVYRHPSLDIFWIYGFLRTAQGQRLIMNIYEEEITSNLYKALSEYENFCFARIEEAEDLTVQEVWMERLSIIAKLKGIL
jgi:hypothetical protein